MSAAQEFQEPPTPEPPTPKSMTRIVLDLEPASNDDGNTLLGNRWLSRGGGALLVGQTGIGKSTVVMQLALCWALGRPCFGIHPAKPLKIVLIQAENDEGDLCEMRDGPLEHLDPSEEEIDLLRNNLFCVFESSSSGQDFITTTLIPILRDEKPDLVILDPALSYLGGDSSEQKTVGPFLRNWLTPALKEHNCGALIVHHTNKFSAADRDAKKKANDFAYAGTGSAEWANWARGVLVLQAKNEIGLRELRIGKRARLGWKDADGNPTFVKLLRQSSEGQKLFFKELTAEEADETLLETPYEKALRFLPEPGSSTEKKVLVALLKTSVGCGKNKIERGIIPQLVNDGYFKRTEIPRPPRRPCIHYLRTEKIPPKPVIPFKVSHANGVTRVDLKCA
jgi:hypothetical protein